MNIDPATSLGMRIRHRTPEAPSISADMPEWMQGALCAQVDPETFYPEAGANGAEAKAVCARRDFRPECLEYALDLDDDFGVYGGLTPNERRKLRRSRGGHACPEPGCRATFRTGQAIGGHRARAHGYRLPTGGAA